MPCKYNKPEVFNQIRIDAHEEAMQLHARRRAAKKQLKANGTDNAFWSMELQQIDLEYNMLRDYLKPTLVERKENG